MTARLLYLLLRFAPSPTVGACLAGATHVVHTRLGIPVEGVEQLILATTIGRDR